MVTITLKTADSLETICQALAEDEHTMGDDATAAGYALIMWAGRDCPWFIAGPTPAAALAVSDFVIAEYE